MSRQPFGGGAALELLDLLADAARERHAPAADPHQHQVVHALVPLHDLVRDAGDDPPQAVGVHDLGLLAQRHASSREPSGQLRETGGHHIRQREGAASARKLAGIHVRSRNACVRHACPRAAAA
jgi:hypothetical protein